MTDRQDAKLNMGLSQKPRFFVIARRNDEAIQLL
jgi:hypothetical protein